MKINKFILGECVEILDYKRIPLSSKERENLEKIYPYYGAQGIIDYVDDYIFDGEYILVAEDGNNLKTLQQNIATLVKGKFWVNNHAHILGEKKGVDLKYIYYLINILDLRGYITGSAQPKLSQENLKKIEINLPMYNVQKKIANLLNLIDSKIELNNKINAELEAMAKTIYDYWFLQFEFPNEEGKPYKSSGGKMVWNEEVKREIPEGWEIKSIFDELSVQYGFPFATDKFTDVKTDIPVVRIRDILTNTISTYSNENVDEKYRLNEQDLLIGMDGNFHMNYWIDNTSYLNQRSVRLRTKDTSNVSIIQVKYNIAPYIKAKEERAGGSTVGHLSDKDLKELKILVPKTKKLREILDNTLMKIVKNRKENQELTSLRDFLLPLLMNGQVGFKEE